MEVDDDEDDFQQLVAAIHRNSRGYQDYWAWKDKPVAERSAVKEAFLAAGYAVDDVYSAEDPPDCWMMIGPTRMSVEHTELVSEKALRQTLKTGRHHYRPWNDEGFRDAISARVAAKSSNLHRYRDDYDENWLLIVSDEYDLDAGRVSDWVSQLNFDLRGFTGALLALSYHPAPEGGYTPVFRLRAE